MELKFSKPYLSIVGFPDTTLTNFTLITGPNGAGKSHLLKAIKGGQIQTSQAKANSEEIRLFDWTQFIPQESGAFDSSTLLNETQNLYQNYQQHQEQLKTSILRTASKVGIPPNYLGDVSTLLRLSSADYLTIFGDSNKAETARSAVLGTARQMEENLFRHLGSERKNQVTDIAQRLNVPTLSLKRDDFTENRIISWGKADLFKDAIGRMFVAYRDLSLQNKLAHLQASMGERVHFLTEDEFTVKHMVAPWVFMNDALKTAGLDFTITTPNELTYGSYEPRLRKRSNGAEVKFADLSSGEKVLMSLALCLYYAEDKRQLTTYPKLLLLDEVDAPLHPAMSRTLIDTITQTLVDKHGIPVIATTHSPSTIALAPEEALYVMTAEKVGIRKISKSKALNLLTVGVPTLSLTYEGRRQVFVESPYDAALYDRIYQIIKNSLRSERSLQFIPTSAKPASGSLTNTGCDTVRRIVTDLVNAGNTSVFGLLDWDGKNSPSTRLHILAEGRRNGLENAVLDPLVICCLLLRNDPNGWKLLGLEEDITYIKFTKLDPSTLQNCVSLLQNAVLKTSDCTKVRGTYLGGLQLDLSIEYLQMDDHKLETHLLREVPALNGVSRGKTGELLKQAIEQVFRDIPEFIPSDIIDAFTGLLEEEAHVEPNTAST